MLGDKQTQQAWMRFADEQMIPHDHEDEDVYKRGFVAGRDSLQWKDVAEGLPEVSGLYVVSVKARGLMITGFASDSDSDKWRWEEKYDRYIPYPIPPYEKKPENG